jgi:hypothetical protein
MSWLNSKSSLVMKITINLVKLRYSFRNHELFLYLFEHTILIKFITKNILVK